MYALYKGWVSPRPGQGGMPSQPDRDQSLKETHAMSHRMRFGIFLAPFHKPGINPTLALEQDLELVQWLDR